MSGSDAYKLELTSAVYPEGKLVPGGLTFSWKLKVVVVERPGTGFINSLSFQNFTGAAICLEAVTCSTLPMAASPRHRAIWERFERWLHVRHVDPGRLSRAPSCSSTLAALGLLELALPWLRVVLSTASSTFASAVPEPTTMVLAFVGLPLLGLYGMRRRAAPDAHVF